MNRTVRVGMAVVAAVAFAVGCNSASLTQTSGVVRVSVSSTGAVADTAFTLLVDGGAQTYPITAGKDLTFSAPTGSYSVELTGVDAACRVAGSNPRTIAVTSGGETAVAFAVDCGNDGSVKVTIATTGQDLDDQYTLSFDDGAKTALVGPNQFITVSLTAGVHTVALQGVAANCAVQGDNPVSFEVPPSAQATAAFAVTCTAR